MKITDSTLRIIQAIAGLLTIVALLYTISDKVGGDKNEEVAVV